MEDDLMSKTITSIMKMPENAKLVDTTSEDISYTGTYDGETKGIAIATSLNWLAGAGSVASFTLLPSESGLIAIPLALAAFVGIVGFCAGFFFLAESIPSGIHKYMKTQSSARKVTTFYSDSLKDGVKISGWGKNYGKVLAHYLLPLRIFKKIKIYESVTYYPLDDRHVKESHYLTFKGFVRVKEDFDGHRAVFQKALDSF